MFFELYVITLFMLGNGNKILSYIFFPNIITLPLIHYYLTFDYFYMTFCGTTGMYLNKQIVFLLNTLFEDPITDMHYV